MALSRTRKPKLTPDEEEARRAFWEEAWGQRCCAVCGKSGPYDPHHVVEKKKLKSVGRADLLWDTRNALRLCPDCHANHTGASRKVPLTKLTAENYEFAFETLEGGAFYYLRAHYDAEDQRLYDHLTRWEEANGYGPDSAAADIEPV